MGKAGRIACIFTPWAMTIVALVLIIIVELGGRSTGSSLLNDVYAWQADFQNMTIPSNKANDIVGLRLQQAKSSGQLQNLYQVHVYNYCSSNGSSTSITYCSPQSTGFVFDPIAIWHLNDTSTKKRDNPVSTATNAVSSTVNSTEAQLEALFGKGAVDTLNAYKTASKWMGIAFQVALWTAVATAVSGILAIFSRWGSLITWILSVISSLFSFGAALTATIIFGSFVGALKAVLDPYKVSISIGGQFLAFIWISTALSIGATSFWLFSVCCCSGKSNPHHKSNKGGLWNAEPKGYAARGMRVEQTGGYQRVQSPYLGAGDRVPLRDYPAPMPSNSPHLAPHPGGAYEPYRQY